ncbi:vomeronasal type-1 receptor 4-like [Tenrec ecaudatus]|uniref:vomeronasal type-1 receptor 4-like n=1 Tax=Tenrec ecaudatus TaxID=94439 RepID=UPI003F5A1086
MSSRNWTLGIAFLLQTTAGILGNVFLAFYQIIINLTKSRLRATDLILKHLTVGNCLLILSRGIPETMAAFGGRDFLSDFGCTVAFYVYRVGRAVSMGSTCLLTIFQAITICPNTPRWAALNVKAPKYMSFSLFLCWILQMLANIILPNYVTRQWNYKNVTLRKDLGYCSIPRGKIPGSLNAVLLSFYDVSCLGLMLWASGSLVSILHRHKLRVQHIHRSNLCPRSSPETRATTNILLLVITFVTFYTLSAIMQAFVIVFNHPSRWMLNVSGLINVCYPTVSPFVFMSSDSSVYRLCYSWIRKT